MSRRPGIRLTPTVSLAAGALTLLLTACGGNSVARSAFPATPAAASATPTGATGHCHVKVAGDVNREWTTPSTRGSVGYGPWIPQTASATAALGHLDATFFVLNCKAADGNYVGFTATGAPIPMTTAVYTIPASANHTGIGSDGPLNALVSLEGTDTTWGASAPGTVSITAFDQHHIAGTFTIPVADLLADVSGTSKGNATVTGDFDYPNPN